MKIHIEYVAQMRDAAGIPGEEVDLPAPVSVQVLIPELAFRHGGRLAELLLDENQDLRSSALVFVGDDQADWGEPLELSDGARVTILAPLAGG